MKLVTPDKQRNEPIDNQSVINSDEKAGSFVPVDGAPAVDITPTEFHTKSNKNSAIQPAESFDALAKKQKRYNEAAKKGHKRGVIFILLGILMLVAAGIFCVSSFLSEPIKVKMTLISQYEVPDGMLQENSVDDATDIVYVYDLTEIDTPYAIENHAMRDGIFGVEDLYEQWDKKSKFRDVTKDNIVASDATNFRKIIIHLPAIAQGYVESDDLSRGSGSSHSHNTSQNATNNGQPNDILSNSIDLANPDTNDDTIPQGVIDIINDHYSTTQQQSQQQSTQSQ